MRKLTMFSVATLALWTTLPTDAHAQHSDEEQIIALVDQMFEALAAGDTATMRGMMVPGTRLVVTTFNQAGSPVYQVISMDQLLGMIASGQGQGMRGGHVQSSGRCPGQPRQYLGGV